VKRTVLIASLSLLVFCFLLFTPLPDNHGNRFLVYLQDFAHFPLFALMAWLLLFLLREKVVNPLWRGLQVVGVTLFAGLLAEFIQPFVGRTAGGRDILLGLAGSVAAVSLDMARRSRTIVARVLLVAMALLLAVAAAFPLILIHRDRQDARRDFPLLASFESRTELSRWAVNGCRVSRVPDHTTHGRWALKIEVENPDNYPGLFESDSMRNVSGIKQLCFDVFVPGDAPLKIWLRMDDRINPVYSDRFQDLRTLFPGTNTICIERAALGSTPSGRSLDLGRILSWGIFFDQAKPGETLYLDNVRVVTE
jgi:VanZ family protein